MLQTELSVQSGSQSRCSDFLSRLPVAPARVLLLDYDGTLAPFCVDRHCATPYPEVLPIIEELHSTKRTRIIVVSGRKASDVARLLGLKRVEIWGSHGLERLRSDGTYEMPYLDAGALHAMAMADDQLEALGLGPHMEFKPGGTAVHWRGLDESIAREIATCVQRVWLEVPNRNGLVLLHFDGGMEIRIAARNKGDVVRTVLAELGPSAAVAYLGDDFTDEDAFIALKDKGLAVLVREGYRPTAADAWLRPPAELALFLKDWHSACGDAASFGGAA